MEEVWEISRRPPRKEEMTMPASKAQQKAVNKYMKENYDRFLLTLRPKGRLNVIKDHAAAQGESTTAFIGRAIQEAIERDRKGGANNEPVGEFQTDTRS